MDSARVSDRVPTLCLEEFDAAILDLDGVVTRTASVHAAAWKHLFDDFLRARAKQTGEPFRPFDAANDYLRYVDGKPRADGVADFLASRGVRLPLGKVDDDESEVTVHGLGNRKNRTFNEHLARHGVAVFESTIRRLQAFRDAGIRTALVSSSRNAGMVLESAGVTDLFDARIDGNDLARLGLRGKPAPDLFLLAAERLGVPPARAIVIEDAISGVEAGRAGGFRHVIGVDRGGAPEALHEAGADIVVSDLAFLDIERRDGNQVGS